MVTADQAADAPPPLPPARPLPPPTAGPALGALGVAAGTAETLAAVLESDPSALVPTWLLACYFCIVVGGGIVANVVLLVTAVRERFGRRRGREAGERTDESRAELSRAEQS